MTNVITAIIIVEIATNFLPVSVQKRLPERADGAGDVYTEVGTVVTNTSAFFVWTNSGNVTKHGVLLDQSFSTNLLTRFRTNPLPSDVTYSVVAPVLNSVKAAPDLPPIP